MALLSVARRFFLLLACVAALSVAKAPAATPPPGAPDLLVLIVSEGGPKDRISFTYRGAVPADQAKRDLAALARELGQSVPTAKISTEAITKDRSSPRMTSVETAFPGLIDRKGGRLFLEPHARAFSRLSRIRVTYFVFGAFKPGSPMATAPSRGMEISVRAQPPVYTFDLWRSAATVASTRPTGTSRLGLLALPILAALLAGIGVYFGVKSWGERGHGSGKRPPERWTATTKRDG